MREWPKVCGNCGHWDVITTLSVVGPGGRYHGGEYKGLCSKDSDLRKTIGNDDCFNGCYEFVGDTDRVDPRRNILRCGVCRYWHSNAPQRLEVFVDEHGCTQKRAIHGADLGDCDILHRETVDRDGCVKGEYTIKTM
jgi:hypothetical protein